MLNSPYSFSLSPAEYLVWEAQQNVRHEYVDGQMIAMAGSTVAHNDIAINLLFVLRPHLQKRGCRINLSDVKVRAQDGDRYLYPDLVISCHSQDRDATQWLEHPQVIIEVLSPSTASYDRSQKLRYYRRIPSLQEYVLVSTDQVLVETYQRQTSSLWYYRDYEPGEMVAIPSLEFECAIDTIYEGITLETTTGADGSNR